MLPVTNGLLEVFFLLINLDLTLFKYERIFFFNMFSRAAFAELLDNALDEVCSVS